MSVLDTFRLEGKVALVTGGSRGLGLQIAEALGEAGASVAITARRAHGLDEAVQHLSSRDISAMCAPCDISRNDQVESAVQAVRDRFGHIDILVNNAGATWGAPLEEFPQSGWDRVIGTNVEGVFHLTVALLPALRAAASADDPARVINIGSIDGLRPSGMENYSYSASKAAVHMLTRHLAQRLAPEQITVNAIAPGPFESKMTAFMFASDEGRAAVESIVPLGRIGRPDDAAGLVQFLCSRAGSYLTGNVIPLDGGITGC
jgi:NAD(P)-dependent dehydrogenase (short-subunit alcohol dehydrogenase family)